MVPSNLPDTAGVHALQAAVATGALALVDADAQPLSLAEAWEISCWAQLRDAEDGQVYVHQLQRGSQELLADRYQELLGTTDFFNAD